MKFQKEFKVLFMLKMRNMEVIEGERRNFELVEEKLEWYSDI